MERSREEERHYAFINWGFQSLLLALVAWGVSALSGLNTSVQELNVKMAVVLTRGEVMGKEQEDMKIRLNALEHGKRRGY